MQITGGVTMVKKELLENFYTTMVKIRAFEMRIEEFSLKAEVPGFVHLYIGEEAIATGVMANLTHADYIQSTHRGHGHCIAKGAQTDRMMAEIFGKKTGYCRGKGGSMHIADFSVGMLGANGVVGDGLAIAVGAAQGLKLLGSDRIAVCMFGDGAMNRGPFLEALNWAALYELPCLFVCEDNGVAAFTASASVTAGPGASARAEALGVPATRVDGNDVGAVDKAVAGLVSDIRAGKGPKLLHADTYRWTGHTSTDPAAWRKSQEVEAGKARCPIAKLKAELGEQGVAGGELDRIEEDARAEMEGARTAANAAAFPAGAVAYEDVQDVGAVVEGGR